MKFFRLAVICCLISMFVAFACERRAAAKRGKCAVPPVEAAYKNSKAVFVGEVKSVVSDGDVKTFTFKVEQKWKGAARGEEIEISVQETMRYQAWFEVGEKYLVYASGEAEGNQLWERRCSRSKSLADASEDIAKLERAKKPAGK